MVQMATLTTSYEKIGFSLMKFKTIRTKLTEETSTVMYQVRLLGEKLTEKTANVLINDKNNWLHVAIQVLKELEQILNREESHPKKQNKNKKR